MKPLQFVSVLLLACLLAGCGDTGTPAPLSTPSATSAPTKTPTPTPEPKTPTPTMTVTLTPTPVLPSRSGVIAVDTAASLALLRTWGKGTLIGSYLLPGGRYILVHTSTGLSVYDSDEEQEVAEWPQTAALTFQINQDQLIIGLGRGEVVLWDTRSGRAIPIDQGYDRETARKWVAVSTVAEELDGAVVNPDLLRVSPDGNTLMIAGRDARIGLWNLADGTLRGFLTPAAGDLIYAAAFSPAGDRLITRDRLRNANTILWDTVNLKSVGVLPGAGSFTSAPFSPDGKQFLTMPASQVTEKHLLFWDSATGIVQSQWTLYMSSYTPSFSADGNYVVIDGVLGQGFSSQRVHEVRSVTDGKQVPEEKAGSIRAYAPPAGASLQAVVPPATADFIAGTFTGVGLNENGGPLAWGLTEENTPFFWIIDQRIVRPANWNRCPDAGQGFSFGASLNPGVMALSPDCRLRANVDGRIIRLEQVSDGELLHYLTGQGFDITIVVFSPGGKYFASGTGWQRYTKFNDVMLWRADPAVGLWKKQIGTGPITAFAFSADDALLAIASDQVRVLRTTDQWFMGSANVVSASAVAISPDGVLLAAADPNEKDPAIAIYQIKGSRRLATLHGTWGVITALAFTPDGTGLMGGAADGTVRFWGIPPQSSGGQ